MEINNKLIKQHFTKSENTVMHKIYYFLSLSLLLFLAVSVSAEMVVQTGVSSPQSESEKDNIEKLRERALRNAMNLAVLQVTGVLVSGQRGDTFHSKEEISIKDNKVNEHTKQKTRTDSNVMSRTTGHVRLVEILNEWRDNQQYYVKAKIKVGDQNEKNKHMNAGFYWERVGRPSIAFQFSEKINHQDTTSENAYTLRFLRDNLAQNGITASEYGEKDIRYFINIIQSFRTEQMTGYGTYTTNCRLSYQIVNNLNQQTVAEHRATHGPNPGFTEEQAQDDCIRAIATQVSEQLVREVATIMNKIWHKGSEYQVSIHNLPGDLITQVSDILKNLFQVSSSSSPSYQNNSLKVALIYQGTAVNLAEAINTVFDEFDTGVVTEAIDRNQIEFHWTHRN